MDPVQNVQPTWENRRWLPLDEALTAGIPAKACSVYKLSVGGSEYIGFTTQDPKQRLEQHIKDAKNDSKQKVHVELRRFGYLYDLEVISQHANEVLGLVAEISNINKHNPSLNVSIGGEGNEFNVVESKNHLGEFVFIVENKSVEKFEDPFGETSENLISFEDYTKIVNGEILYSDYHKSQFQPTKQTSMAIFNLGEGVVHDKFGYGEIMNIEGEKLDIEFDNVGSKTIIAQYIKKVDDQYAQNISLDESFDISSSIEIDPPYIQTATKFNDLYHEREKLLFQQVDQKHLYQFVTGLNLEGIKSVIRYFPFERRPVGGRSEDTIYFKSLRDAKNYVTTCEWFQRGIKLGHFNKSHAIYPIYIKTTFKIKTELIRVEDLVDF
ncbi:hypothetical protein OAC90_00310 [Planktomarina sp.]|nr:hypothetical protein [Planktomarina sp.]